MDQRLSEITIWLTESLSIDIISLEPASQDASFRRYFRAVCRNQKYGASNTLIVMDAPPSQESLHEFISIGQALVAHQVHAPAIYEINLEKGFLLLEDLGNDTYLDSLNGNSTKLYTAAIDALVAIQNIGRTEQAGFDVKSQQAASASVTEYRPPEYDHRLINQELELFITWYCNKHLQINLTEQQQSVWDSLKLHLETVFEEQPKVWVHRDYHSRNLMITKDNSPGVIDFQDMVWGPISYDLASIFKDCYIEWPREIQTKWLEKYLQKLNSISTTDITLPQLIKWYDLTGLQRHIKVLGIFCRLNYRDGKSNYLSDLPLVEKYVSEVLAIYPELHSFKTIFESLPNNDT